MTAVAIDKRQSTPRKSPGRLAGGATGEAPSKDASIEQGQASCGVIDTRLLVLGSTGLVGTELLQRLQLPMQGMPWTRERLDITSAEHVQETILKHRPDVVINATAVWKDSDHGNLLWQVNADGAANVARACAMAGVPLLHLSDARIYGGCHRRVAYQEDDTPRATCHYSQSKLAAEHAVLRAADAAKADAWRSGFRFWIVRTAPLFSLEFTTPLATTAKRIAMQKQVAGCLEVCWQPTAVSQLVEHLLWLLVNRKNVPSGIYHIASSEAASEFRLYERMASILGAHRPIQAISYVDKCRIRGAAVGGLPCWYPLDCSRWQRLCPLPLPSWSLLLGQMLRNLSVLVE